MAGRSTHTVNNIPAGVCIDQGKEAEQRYQNLGNQPGEYTYNNTGFGTGKI